MTIRWGPALLFCPADNPRRIGRAASEADVVVIDLEDGVHSSGREAARTDLLTIIGQLDPAKTIVRVNRFGTTDLALDLAVLSRTAIRTVMLPKAESVLQLESLDEWSVVGLCETPRGVISATTIAVAENCAGLMWGSEDLAAELGGGASRSATGQLSDIMRKAQGDVLMAAKAAAVPAIDAVFIDIGNLSGFRAEAREAAQMGFDVKACIHPSQLATVRESFKPSAEDAQWAAKVLDVSEGSEVGARTVANQMVDEAVLRRARTVVARSGSGAVETE